jgi:hypothetical protein
MPTKVKAVTTHTPAGEPRFKVIPTAINTSDIQTSRRRARTKPPELKPRDYLKSLGVPFKRYVNIRAEEVSTDGTPATVFVVTTGGGCRGAHHVDTWSEIAVEHPRPGFVALASARTCWNIWVSGEGDFERAAAVAIARATGIKHPPQHI